MAYKITKQLLRNFETYLKNAEKAESTLIQYIRDIKVFFEWLGGRTVDKHRVMEYKHKLIDEYAPRSVNAKLASLNSFFNFCKWFGCKVKSLKIQKQIFARTERELTKKEYEALLNAAKRQNKQRLYRIIQTICATGIRVSELRFITAEAVKNGRATINCKGKMRDVFLPNELCKILAAYMKKYNIVSGCVFVTKRGNPIDRSNIWSEMKKLCKSAGVSEKKVFPHNLRHLFAKTFYTRYKDIVKLADILGHSSIDTTRIYTMESGDVHRRQLQKLGLLMC